MVNQYIHTISQYTWTSEVRFFPLVDQAELTFLHQMLPPPAVVVVCKVIDECLCMTPVAPDAECCEGAKPTFFFYHLC